MTPPVPSVLRRPGEATESTAMPHSPRPKGGPLRGARRASLRSIWEGAGRRALPLLGLLGSCAHLPDDLPPRPSLKTPAVAATLQAASGGMAGEEAADASGTWWQRFGREDLNRLVDAALRDQPGLAAAQARLDAAQRMARLARLEIGPQYSTDASLTRNRLSDNGLFPTDMAGKNYTQAGISQRITYDLDWWHRNGALLRAAQSAQQAARDEAAAMRLDVAAAVAEGYFTWAEISSRLTQARALLRCRRQQLDLLQRRHALGLDAAHPVLDVRRKLDLDEDRVRQLEYLDRAARYRMGALIGSDPDHAGTLAAPSLDARLPALPRELPLDWLARRPDIAALRERIASASARSEAARAEFYPNVNLGLMAGVESLDLGTLFRAGSIVGIVGPALHLPLFNGRTLEARLGLREAEYAGAVAAYNHAILAAAQQGADAHALVASLDQRGALQHAALLETEQIRLLATRRQALGLAAPLEALDAEATLLDQRMSATETQGARLRARVALFHAIGGDTSLGDAR